jgi:hypothetical protein
MLYERAHAQLHKIFSLSPDSIDLEGCGATIHNEWFDSKAWSILPGASNYACEAHGHPFAPGSEHPCCDDAPDALDVADFAVGENRRFRYAIMRPRRVELSRGAILIVHGLNERSWNKYLPWALRLVEATGKAVVLFPMAFHMNRAPSFWSQSRLMRSVSRQRQLNSPSIANSSLANAAISTRLASNPRRFCWSGLQTLCDIAQFVDEIRSGRHAFIASDAEFDLFGYSIGAFLCEILLMADFRQRFTETRLFMFCGGATVDRTYPNSRYILDSDATIALYSFFLARFENELRLDERLAHHLGPQHPEGLYFRSMLSYLDGKRQRERRLRDLADRIAAVALRQDTVVPATEVLNTLQGEFRDIPVPVHVADFGYPHDHVTPFPLDAPSVELERSFNLVFDRAAAHLA